MTREKLESLHIIRKEIRNIDTMIRRERDRATSTVSGFYATPGGGGISDKTGEGGVNLCELEERRKELQRKYQARYTEIVIFVGAITDPVLKKIIAGRCVRDWKWLRVAIEVGGGNTEATVRQRYNRFVRQLQEK